MLQSYAAILFQTSSELPDAKAGGPWMVSIWKDGNLHCSGSIIGKIVNYVSKVTHSDCFIDLCCYR